jgi:hypothetical protein
MSTQAVTILIAVCGLVVSILGFIVNGALGRRWGRGRTLLSVDDLSKYFPLRSEFATQVKAEAEWREWLVREVVAPLNDLAKTQSSVATTLAVHAEAVKYLSSAIDDLREDIRDVRRVR